MSGPATDEEVVSLVTAAFDATEVQRESESILFRLNTGEFKARFVDLAQRLEARDLACKIHRSGGEIYLSVMRLDAGRRGGLRSSPWIPRILFAVVVGFIMVDGYYRTVGINQITQIGDPWEVAAVYTAAFIGILGVHELGHMAASRIHRIRTTWPYFIPGLPVIGIPTFGAIIMAKGLMINREKTFDMAIAGPIAGLVITVVVAVYAASTAPIMDPAAVEALYESQQLSEWQFGEPLLMTASLALFEKDGEGVVLMTPLLFAAWAGFFLTFANMMPAGQLDGGHLVRTVFGRRTLRILTYASAAVLFMMNFWFVAIFVLLMSGRMSGIVIMDDITPVSRGRKASYAAVVVLAVLCAPIPEGSTAVESWLRLVQQLPFA